MGTKFLMLRPRTSNERTRTSVQRGSVAGRHIASGCVPRQQSHPKHLELPHSITESLYPYAFLLRFPLYPSVSLHLTCPLPYTIYFKEVSSFNPIGPLACNFCVLIPISAPKPNSNPSVKRVEAFT